MTQYPVSASNYKFVRVISALITGLLMCFLFLALFFLEFRSTQLPAPLELDFLTVAPGKLVNAADSGAAEHTTQQKIAKKIAQRPVSSEQVVAQPAPSPVTVNKNNSHASVAQTKTAAKYAFNKQAEYDSPSTSSATSQTQHSSIMGETSKGTGQNIGIEGDLSGRGVLHAPRLSTGCTVKGTIVVDVVVDDQGVILDARINYKHPKANTSDACSIEEALRIVKQISFSPSRDLLMTGTLVLNFL